LREMASGEVKPQELEDAKSRAIGGLVMDTQTIGQQATRRIDQILNGYPVDYYDQLPQRLVSVTAPQAPDVVAKYVDDQRFVIVVVGPAAQFQTEVEAISA